MISQKIQNEKLIRKKKRKASAQGSDASNSIKVLTRLVGSGAMLVFLCDSTIVLSRPAGSEATLEMKLRL